MTHLPFRLSTSAEDADPDTKLLVTAASQRALGEIALDDHGVVFTLAPSEPGALRVLRVPYTSIGSAVLRAGILTSRLRLTARDDASFADVAPGSPREVTLLVERKYRHDARHFTAALQVRIAEARLPGQHPPSA
jgi:hypothetical protein